MLPDARTVLTAGLVGFCGYGLSLVMYALALRHLGAARTVPHISRGQRPAVIGMAGALGLDEFAIIDRLHKLWSWADQHCQNGHAKNVTFVWINRPLATS